MLGNHERLSELCWLINERADLNRKRRALMAKQFRLDSILNCLVDGCKEKRRINKDVQKYMSKLARQSDALRKEYKAVGTIMKKKQKVISRLVREIPRCFLAWDHSWGIEAIVFTNDRCDLSHFEYLFTRSDEFKKLVTDYEFRSEMANVLTLKAS